MSTVTSLPKFGDWNQDETKSSQRYSWQFKKAHIRRLSTLGKGDGQDVDANDGKERENDAAEDWKAGVELDMAATVTRGSRDDESKEDNRAVEAAAVSNAKVVLEKVLGDESMADGRGADIVRVARMLSRMRQGEEEKGEWGGGMERERKGGGNEENEGCGKKEEEGIKGGGVAGRVGEGQQMEDCRGMKGAMRQWRQTLTAWMRGAIKA